MANLPRPSTPEATARAIVDRLIEECIGPLDPADEDAVIGAMQAIITAALAAAVADEHNRRIVAEEQLRMMTENALSLKAALAAAEARGPAPQALEPHLACHVHLSQGQHWCRCPHVQPASPSPDLPRGRAAQEPLTPAEEAEDLADAREAEARYDAHSVEGLRAANIPSSTQTLSDCGGYSAAQDTSQVAAAQNGARWAEAHAANASEYARGRAAGLREAADLIDALEPLDTSLIAAVAKLRALATEADQ